MLSTVAGSLITVVATVFSLTIVALQLASSSYSPRLLRNFTSDRGVQVVLGAYIGTFAYALLVLRIIRTPESQAATTFLPVISVTVAVLLAFICVGLLIYFVHHVSTLIQSSNIVARAHRDAAESIAGLAERGNAPAENKDSQHHPDFQKVLCDQSLMLRARQSGYIQYLDTDRLLEAVAGAGAADGGRLIVEVPLGPGGFVSAGLPLVRVWPAPEDGLNGQGEKRARKAFLIGKERSFKQDFAFGLRQLSDIALRGVSPGVNDPTTSMQAMDRMEAIFLALGEKAMPPQVQEREIAGRKVLLRIGYYDFEDTVGLAFDQLRRASFTSGQVAVLERLLEIIGRALEANDLPERQRALWERAFTVGRLAPSHISDPRDAVRLARRAVGVGAPLLKTELASAICSDLEDIADLSEGLREGEQVRRAVDNAWDPS